MTEVAARDGGAWRLGCAVLPGLAAATVATWIWGPAGALLGLPVALWRWRAETAAPARLGLGPEGWRLDGAAIEAPEVVIDFGGWMLLTGGGRWLPLSSSGVDADWPALRAALFAAATPPEPGAAA